MALKYNPLVAALSLQRWKLRPDHLDEFVDLWAEYDDGSGTIDPKDLEGMLLRWGHEGLFLRAWCVYLFVCFSCSFVCNPW
jgi:hypothetical protein